MPWFPVDDAFHSHPKARKAGLEAIGLWAVSGSFCMAYLTDGFVPEWFVREKPRGVTLAKRLIEANLWRLSECNGERGYQFHDWKPECTKAHVMDVREKARLRKAKSRESQQESRVTAAGQDVGVLGFTQPNPTQPINPLVTSSGGATEGNTRETPPPTKCRKHINDNNPPNCRACADARRARDDWAQAMQQNELSRRRRLRLDRDACALCDENGMRETPNGLTRCNHQAAGNA